MNGAELLWAIREENGDLPAICRRLQKSRATVVNQIRWLAEVGLVENKGGWKLTEQWNMISAVLGISLSSLVFERDEMRIRPYFGKPRGIPSLDVFVAMPFRLELRPIYEDHILPVLKKLSLKVKRADDFFSVNSVIEDIWKAINAAKVVIADCTGRNPNVFYEIGLAHTLGKPVVLITQSGDDVPFDLKAIRYIEYQYTPPGMRTFENRLQQTVEETLKDLPHPGRRTKSPD
jgi:hypothetical protein